MDLKTTLQEINERIAVAAVKSGRSAGDVRLVAVTKTHPPSIISEAYAHGLRDFGENRVQELIVKHYELPEDIRWHLIGHLQSNKAKYIAQFVGLVHSIDSLETAKELLKRATLHSRTAEILLEVNVGAEASKDGVSVDGAKQLLDSIREEAPEIIIRGLMTVAPFDERPERIRPVFAKLRTLRDELSSAHPDLPLTELSMGMSNDYEIAIEEGATIVRVGSALFGERGK